MARGNEHFLTVNYIVVAIANCGRFDVLDIAATRRLRHAERNNDFASRRLGQLFLILLLGIVGNEVWRNDLQMEIKRRAGCASQRHLFDHNGRVKEVAATATKFFRNGRAQKAPFDCLQPQIARNNASLFSFSMMRHHRHRPSRT